jgi:hypothetical protein
MGEPSRRLFATNAETLQQNQVEFGQRLPHQAGARRNLWVSDSQARNSAVVASGRLATWAWIAPYKEHLVVEELSA